ncbi:hypothetical protein WDZ92_28100 [Nostoc sp. NIES-2111]
MAIRRDPSPIARRAVLAGVCTLPFSAPAATLAMAVNSGPRPAADPVFAALDAHAVALKDWHAASDAFGKAERDLLDRAGHFLPSIKADFPGADEIH